MTRERPGGEELWRKQMFNVNRGKEKERRIHRFLAYRKICCSDANQIRKRRSGHRSALKFSLNSSSEPAYSVMPPSAPLSSKRRGCRRASRGLGALRFTAPEELLIGALQPKLSLSLCRPELACHVLPC